MNIYISRFQVGENNKHWVLLLPFFKSVIYFFNATSASFCQTAKSFLKRSVTRRWSKARKVFITSITTVNFKLFSSNILIMQPVIAYIIQFQVPLKKHFFCHYLYGHLVDDFASGITWSLSLRQASCENQSKAQLLHCSQNIL